MTTRKRLCAIKGISEAKVDKIKVEAVHFVSFMVNLRAALVVTKRLLEVVLSDETIENVCCCFWCIMLCALAGAMYYCCMICEGRKQNNA